MDEVSIDYLENYDLVSQRRAERRRSALFFLANELPTFPKREGYSLRIKKLPLPKCPSTTLHRPCKLHGDANLLFAERGDQVDSVQAKRLRDAGVVPRLPEPAYNPANRG